MENAASIRAQSAVAAFDATDYLTEYGLRVADPQALETARKVVDTLVSEAMVAVDEYFDGMKKLGQNPYREKAAVGGKDLRFVAPVGVFAESYTQSSIDQAFETAKAARPSPVIFTKIERELAKRLEEHGFEIRAFVRHQDGSLARIALRDPVYAATAENLRPSAAAIVDVRAALDALENSYATTPGGIQHLVGIVQADDAAQWIDDFARAAIEKVAAHFQAAITYGRTPFENGGGYFKHKESSVVDETRFGLDGTDDYVVPRRVIIAIEVADRLVETFCKQFGVSADTIRGDLKRHVRDAIAEQLKALPDLRGALVGYTDPKEPGSGSSTLAVVCGSEVLRPKLQHRLSASTAKPLSWWQSFLGLFRGQPVLALPPPQSVPAALPAPAPVVVPPLDAKVALRPFELEVRQ